MHSLAQRVLSHIRRQELLKPGHRVGVAVSGGIDSVALLRLLLELRHDLGIVLSVVHFNHKLRGAESDADEQFVANLAREHNLEFHTDSDDVAQHAAEERISVEAAARELRYGFFDHLLNDQSLNNITTGHTLDDQAETVLMRLIRGAGLRGLGGIYPRIAVHDQVVHDQHDDRDGQDAADTGREIIRPLLSFRRRELEQYLKNIGQTWREDSSNADDAFTRNRVRQLVIPLLEKEFNPAVAENLAELAEIARGEEDYWENEIAGWMGTAVHWSEPDWARQNAGDFVQIALPQSSSMSSPATDSDLRSRINAAPWLVMNASLDRLWFLGEPLAVQRRLIKSIGEQAGVPLEFKHVEEVLRFAADGQKSGKELSLPLGWTLVQEPDAIVFLTPDLLTPDLRETAPACDYEYDLPVPGRVAIYEIGSILEAHRISASDATGYNSDHLLDEKSLPGPLRVRNWHPGDRFWPAHTKSPKKIKELLQELHVPQPERKRWPLIVSENETSGDEVSGHENEIVWLRGFPAPAKLLAQPGQQAIVITERRITEKPSAEASPT